LQDLAGPTNGCHLSVTGNIVLCSDTFDSLGDDGAPAHNDRAHWRFTALASNSRQFQTQAHERFMLRISHRFHIRAPDRIENNEKTAAPWAVWGCAWGVGAAATLSSPARPAPGTLQGWSDIREAETGSNRLGCREPSLVPARPLSLQAAPRPASTNRGVRHKAACSSGLLWGQ
jgi:hypothetical protein